MNEIYRNGHLIKKKVPDPFIPGPLIFSAAWKPTSIRFAHFSWLPSWHTVPILFYLLRCVSYVTLRSGKVGLVSPIKAA